MPALPAHSWCRLSLDSVATPSLAPVGLGAAATTSLESGVDLAFGAKVAPVSKGGSLGHFLMVRKRRRIGTVGMNLLDWQERLEEHFRALRERRTTEVGDQPVFALEHGLRFRQFAQEPLLIGQITATLFLRGERGTLSLILPSTLTRIVEDLNRERYARMWMHGAWDSARCHLRLAGVAVTRREASTDDGHTEDRSREGVVPGERYQPKRPGGGVGRAQLGRGRVEVPAASAKAAKVAGEVPLVQRVEVTGP